MSIVFPGKPQPRLQTLTTGRWGKGHITAYITGNAFAVLDSSREIVQTVYDDDEAPLVAIAFDEHAGKIATSTSSHVRIYRPRRLSDDTPQWALQLVFEIPHPPHSLDTQCVVSWGTSEELLVATSALSLFSTESEPECLWEKQVPNPIMSASLSWDSSHIVSISHYDRLVKVWRRLNYGDQVRFDMVYLQHPAAVTSFWWRKPSHAGQTSECVLYTLCTDCIVRAWIPTNTQDGKRWQMWGELHIGSPAGKPIREIRDTQLVIIVDSSDFGASVDRAINDRIPHGPGICEGEKRYDSAVSRKNSEICLVVDGEGLLSVWAFQEVSSSVSDGISVFSIKQNKFDKLGHFHDFLSTRSSQHVEARSYYDKLTGCLNILLHAFDGRIGIFTTNAAALLDPRSGDGLFRLETIWTGHCTSITKIIRNFSGSAVVSRTNSGECTIWKHAPPRSKNAVSSLRREYEFSGLGHIHRISLLHDGKFVVFLQERNIAVWDCRFQQAVLAGQCQFDITGKPLCLVILPRPQVKNYAASHLATITSQGEGIVWEINLPNDGGGSKITAHTCISEFARFRLEDLEGLSYVLPVDPAGSNVVHHGFLDAFAPDVAISYTDAGRVDFWTTRVNDGDRKVDWLSTSTTETGIMNPALASGSMLKKTALVDSTRSQLTIWDIGGSRLEFDETYDTHHAIQDIDWSATPDLQSILAVGFQHRVVILSQMRFDYVNKGPAWAPIREIGIQKLTPHPIGDSTWLSNGRLVVGAGHQMFVYDRHVHGPRPSMTGLGLSFRSDGTWDLFEAVQRLNGPLPVFHPQFLGQCILAGKGVLVRRILFTLHQTLKYHIPGDIIDNYLGLTTEEFYLPPSQQCTCAGQRRRMRCINGHDDTSEDEQFTENTATLITEKLTHIRIPQLSGHEQIQLADITECVALVERHRRSMDENGARFMLFYRQNALRKGRASDVHISWREINWAYHSKSQDLLVEFVSRQNHGKIVWEHARESGVFMWLSDISAVRTVFETIARNEYTRNDDKNPVGCSLFYLALRKKTVLQGLWRIANSNKEQVATQRLLAHDFSQQKWKTAALKNAYALLSKRRFKYAAAFFLLADNLGGAVEVCLNQLKDIQLAIALARVYEGDGGLVLRKILQDEVLMLAAQDGNRWLASWAFWLLGRKDMAVRALVTPLYTLLDTPSPPDIRSRLFLTADPALVVLYEQLRQQTLQTLSGASKVAPKAEWEFVLHSAKLYDRMGCDLLGLDLVRNWEFQKPSPVGFGGEVNPLQLFKRRSSLIVNDQPALSLQNVASGTGSMKTNTSPTPFVEPDMGSLLDSFGF